MGIFHSNDFDSLKRGLDEEKYNRDKRALELEMDRERLYEMRLKNERLRLENEAIDRMNKLQARMLEQGNILGAVAAQALNDPKLAGILIEKHIDAELKVRLAHIDAQKELSAAQIEIEAQALQQERKMLEADKKRIESQKKHYDDLAALDREAQYVKREQAQAADLMQRRTQDLGRVISVIENSGFSEGAIADMKAVVSEWVNDG